MDTYIYFHYHHNYELWEFINKETDMQYNDNYVLDYQKE